MKFFHLKKVQHKKGFTLMEMIVVIAIMAIVTTLVLFNNGRLNSAILVSNTGYEIGLIIRESQVAGLGVKATADGFSSSYGVHFDIAEPNKVILFADKNLNGIYDPADSEMTQEYDISNARAGSILGICSVSSLAAPAIPYCNVSNTKSTADIVFARPNPEALFKVRDVSSSAPTDYIGALVINVGFLNDVCRSIVVEKTGAVSVDTRYCSPIL